ncbi:TPA: hypothetical protein N2D99_001952 [Clostridium botulinum]|nr:hypothetical protein [Clostridium botulinum]
MIYERFISQIIKDNCKTNAYIDKFGKEMQKEIKDNNGAIADIVLENPEIIKHMNEEIEEAIRLYILRK